MNKYFVYVVLAVVALAFLFVLLKLSNSRFEKLKLSYKGTPAPYNPYVYDYHPVEGFTDEEDALKDAGPRVKVYTEQNFKGSSKLLDKNTVLDTNFASKIKSLMVGPYTKASLYISKNPSGESISFINEHDLWLEIPVFNGQQSKFSNNVKSIKLELVEPYVIAYTQNNLGGFSKIFHEKHPILGKNWEKQIKSLVISPYTKVTLYKRAGLSPDPSDVEPITNSTANEMKINYVGREADGNIRSLKVEALF